MHLMLKTTRSLQVSKGQDDSAASRAKPTLGPHPPSIGSVSALCRNHFSPRHQCVVLSLDKTQYPLRCHYGHVTVALTVAILNLARRVVPAKTASKRPSAPFLNHYSFIKIAHNARKRKKKEKTRHPPVQVAGLVFTPLHNQSISINSELVTQEITAHLRGWQTLSRSSP
jgi:hypothetical protein